MLLQRNISFFYDIFHFNHFDLQFKKERKKWYFLGNSNAKKSVIADNGEIFEVESLLVISRKYDEKQSIVVSLPPMNSSQLLLLLGLKKDEFDLIASFKQLSEFGLSEVNLKDKKEGIKYE